MCNTWGTIVYPAHFYNALRQKVNPVKHWPLMDEVLAIHTEEQIFLGHVPTSSQECFRQASLTLGYSATIFAANRRQKINKIPVSKAGPRGLKPTTVLTSFFKQGVCHVSFICRNSFSSICSERLICIHASGSLNYRLTAYCKKPY